MVFYHVSLIWCLISLCPKKDMSLTKITDIIILRRKIAVVSEYPLPFLLWNALLGSFPSPSHFPPITYKTEKTILLLKKRKTRKLATDKIKSMEILYKLLDYIRIFNYNIFIKLWLKAVQNDEIFVHSWDIRTLRYFCPSYTDSSRWVVRSRCDAYSYS